MALKMNKFRSFLANPLTGFILFALLLIVLQFFSDLGFVKVQFMRTVGRTIIYSIVTMGFAILLGYGGLASLGTAGFIGFGAYMSEYLLRMFNLNYFVILVATILVAILIGIIFGFISLRIEGMYLAIVTLVLSAIFVEVFRNVWGPNVIVIPTINLFGILLNRENMYYLIIFFFVLFAILTTNIMRSPAGRAMLAMKNSDSAAQAMGVNVLKYRVLAFIISAIYALFAGALYLGYFRNTGPEIWNLSLSLNILAAIVLGGSKSVWGAVLGCFLIFGIDGMVLQQIPFFVQNAGFATILNGALMVIIVMFYPGGLIRMIQGLRYKWKMRAASRKGGKHA